MSCEGIAKAIDMNATYKDWESCKYILFVTVHRFTYYLLPGYLSPQSVRRLHALLASPLVLLGHLSTTYLLFGQEVSL